MKTPKTVDEFKNYRHAFVHLDQYRNSYLNLADMCAVWRLNRKVIERDVIKPFMFEFVQFGGIIINDRDELILNAEQSILLMGFIRHLRLFAPKHLELIRLVQIINDKFTFLDGLAPDTELLYEYAHVSILMAKKKALIKSGLDEMDAFPIIRPKAEVSVSRAEKKLQILTTMREKLEDRLFA